MDQAGPALVDGDAPIPESSVATSTSTSHARPAPTPHTRLRGRVDTARERSSGLGRIGRFVEITGTVATITPLLGLLGTVLGMIRTFEVISIFGTGNARAMAGGISVALITTQTGLMVSIPGLYMSGFLTKRANNLKYRIAATGMYLKRFL